ncbi:MAG TPA: hypothetical protein VET90_09650 [Candidatus Binatus sp.]|nr:hypothetical protein [Candidatus Binatus sp.]
MSNSIDPISAKKTLESLLHIGQDPRDNPGRQALDREEERVAEYEVMGLQAPPPPAAPPGILDRLARLLRGAV